MSGGAGPAILRVAVPVPLPTLFDYLPPPGIPAIDIPLGTRLVVPFGRGRRVGVLVEMQRGSTLPPERIKPALAVLDKDPLLSEELLASLDWVARYYQYPLGEVLAVALPAGLRRLRPPTASGDGAWMLRPGVCAEARPGSTSAALLSILAGGPLRTPELDARLPNWRSAASHLRRRGLIQHVRLPSAPPLPPVYITPPPRTAEQDAAVQAITDQFGQFAPFLLEGITGSGKTEVYLALAERALAARRQVLLLVPEIGLSPLLLRRLRERTACRIHVLHSDLGEGERTQAWLAAARGEADVILGTRSAIFTPLPRAGLIVVDEEHDPSYKQNEGLRYSARDLAVVRAKALGVPIVLGSATPSLETLANADSGRYRHLQLGSRPGAARVPRFRLVDLRGQHLVDGLAPALLQALGACLARGEQALLFRNRRGYAPVLRCHTCGWHASCARCDKPLTWHRAAARLRCHHCAAEIAAPIRCPQCDSAELGPRGHGTERLEQALRRHFPGVPVVRIDRETTSRRAGVDVLLQRLAPDQPGIYVGTQILAKGHDLPNLTWVGLIGADDGLFSVDFRASERLCQLITQVAGRAGRAHKPGEVWLQTYHPEHPLLRDLLRHGYAYVARELLAERRLAGLPPFAHLALLRAEASSVAQVEGFLAAARAIAGRPVGVECVGPMPSPMPRRAGRHRGQLLLRAAERKPLHGFLPGWVAGVRALPEARRVRWSLDVDPLDLY
jgi:primosomal protein N' (replication factor Y)